MPAFMRRFRAEDDQAILDQCSEVDGALPVYIAVDSVNTQVHWRLVWSMTGPPTEANPNGSEGWHVLEIFVARDNNPTGEYVFRRHFRPLQHGSARNWAPFLVGQLDRESRESLAAYCSDQDPTRVGSSQGSNCITCVVNSIRALYITNDEHERRLGVARTIPHDPVNDYNHHDHFDDTAAEQAIADAYNYTGNGGASTSRSTQRPSA